MSIMCAVRSRAGSPNGGLGALPQRLAHALALVAGVEVARGRVVRGPGSADRAEDLLADEPRGALDEGIDAAGRELEVGGGDFGDSGRSHDGLLRSRFEVDHFGGSAGGCDGVLEPPNWCCTHAAPAPTADGIPVHLANSHAPLSALLFQPPPVAAARSSFDSVVNRSSMRSEEHTPELQSRGDI